MWSHMRIMWLAVMVVSALVSVATAEPPVADAGDDQRVYICDPALTKVVLDGSGSYDPDGGALTYDWTWYPAGAATGVDPTISLPPGEHVVTLVVNDGTEDSPEDQMTIRIVVDDSGPEVDVLFPAAQIAVQDAITLKAEASDPGGVASVSFALREPDTGTGADIGWEDLAATYNDVTGEWEYALSTVLLLDGYYVVLAKAADNCVNETWGEIVLFSIRNEIVAEVEDLLPPSRYNAGRTVPVKFALKVPADVDATQPYVYNEELEIRIHLVGDSDNTLLQTSVYGDASTDYRLADSARHYITNFKTLDTEDEYLVEIWRTNGDLDDERIGSFGFETAAHPGRNAAQVHRFWSPKFQRHFYTINAGEKDKLKNRYAAAWVYEDVAFYAFADDLEPGVLPVHRFYSPSLKAHFFTIVESEKNKLMNKLSHAWKYEGVAFYAYPEGQQPADAVPLHRFWSDSLGAHFFTSSEAEKDKLIADYADVWTHEGVAWYAY